MQAMHDLKGAGRWRSASEWRAIMKTRYTVALSMIAGAALGATAIQGLHAQAKKAYLISESEIIDRSAVEGWNKQIREVTQKAGGGSMVFSDRVVGVVGTPPQRVVVSEFPSADKAQAYLNSAERKAAIPNRDKAIKLVSQYIIEGN
jgi:uncharacterized protein (DUF1330 family)